MRYQLWDGLPSDVYERLCDCRSRREDILPLAISVYRNNTKGYTAEQAIEYTLEHLSCNSQDFCLENEEWDEYIEKLERNKNTPQKSPAQKIYDKLSYIGMLDTVIAQLDVLQQEIQSGIIKEPGLPKRLGNITKYVSDVRNGIAEEV